MDGLPRSVGGVSVMVLSLERFLEANEIITTRPDVDSFGFVVVDSYEYFYEYSAAIDSSRLVRLFEPATC